MNKTNKLLKWVETQLNILNTFGANQFQVFFDSGWNYQTVFRDEIEWVDNCCPFYYGMEVDGLSALDDLDEKNKVEICLYSNYLESWEVGCFCR